jgi:hypothetical protein
MSETRCERCLLASAVAHRPTALPAQVVMCKHRMGMICAAMRDSGTASKLLEETKAHYEAVAPGHDLAREAALGLALVALRQADSLAGEARREQQQQVLAHMRDQVGAVLLGGGVTCQPVLLCQLCRYGVGCGVSSAAVPAVPLWGGLRCQQCCCANCAAVSCAAVRCAAVSCAAVSSAAVPAVPL